MRISILAIGSRGDVQPLIALALGLGDAGHDVTITTHRGYADLAEAFGLSVVPLSADAKEVLATSEADFMREGQRSALRGFYRLVRMVAPYLDSMSRESLDASHGADVMIHSFLATAIARTIGEKLKLPVVIACWAPYLLSSEVPIAGAAQPPVWFGPLSRPYNRLTYRVAHQVMWRAFRRPTNAWRRDIGLPPISLGGPLGDARRGVGLFSFSEALCPRPSDWPASMHVTGFWYLPSSHRRRPPSRVTDFLRAGDPPVLVTFGSQSADRGPRVLHSTIQALRCLGLRGILTGFGTDPSIPSPGDDMCMVPDVPFEWLLQNVSAVVHHGGAGTVAEVLRAGLPSVVIPLAADNPFFAHRLHVAGVAPAPLDARRLTIGAVQSAIQTVMVDGGMRQRAESIRRHIAAEDGVAQAVAALEAEMGWVR